jgi:hypothetical protein
MTEVYVLWSDYDEIGAVFLNREAAERAWELSEWGGVATYEVLDEVPDPQTVYEVVDTVWPDGSETDGSRRSFTVMPWDRTWKRGVDDGVRPEGEPFEDERGRKRVPLGRKFVARGASFDEAEDALAEAKAAREKERTMSDVIRRRRERQQRAGRR